MKILEENIETIFGKDVCIDKFVAGFENKLNRNYNVCRNCTENTHYGCFNSASKLTREELYLAIKNKG